MFKVKKALENYDLKSRINHIYKNKNYNYIAKSELSKKTLNSLKKLLKQSRQFSLWRKSGREFLAKKIHSESNRFFKNFKVLDFNNILESEIESEIFGKEESQIVKKNGIF